MNHTVYYRTDEEMRTPTNSMSVRNRLIANLPKTAGRLVIRLWRREDLDSFAQWPSYPFPYEAFNLSILGASSQELDKYFFNKESDRNRLSMVVDREENKVIGCFVFMDIDWGKGMVCNMTIRIRPDWCGRGIGTTVLMTICEWGYEHGLKKIRIDVAGPNIRAIRCYENAGFKKVGELWRDDLGLAGMDLDRLEKASIPIRSHVRFKASIPQLRFFWMERSLGKY
jgi:RimJ/RimL family protein N-acetyltransferase